MTTKVRQEAQQPLILRAHRLMEAFTKSDDERDFYLDRQEGFIIYVDLDKGQSELEALEKELTRNSDRYGMIPKLTFYETKKIMEGFVNEKVYDIDTKEKLLDIIQSKEARSNFLEFIYDHLTELEKWQQYYQERSRVRIIEWLRTNHFHFVFEEDLELAKGLIEKLKQNLFQARVSKELLNARKALQTKAKTYYSNEALNPRPKRGRPPKQVAKQEIESQVTTDIYTTVPNAVRPFLFTPEISSASAVTFSASFDNPELNAARRLQTVSESDQSMEGLQTKLAALRSISSKWVKNEEFGEEEEDEDRPSNNAPSAKMSARETKPNDLSRKAKPLAKIKPPSTRKRHLRPINSKGAGRRQLQTRPRAMQRSAPVVKTPIKKASKPKAKTQSIIKKPVLKKLAIRKPANSRSSGFRKR